VGISLTLTIKSVGQERNMSKNIAISVLFVFCIIGFGVSSLASFKISSLEKNVEAHKLAMTYANQAIHTLYDETLFLKDKGIKL
jgi:hypothetical protein